MSRVGTNFLSGFVEGAPHQAAAQTTRRSVACGENGPKPCLGSTTLRRSEPGRSRRRDRMAVACAAAVTEGAPPCPRTHERSVPACRAGYQRCPISSCRRRPTVACGPAGACPVGAYDAFASGLPPHLPACRVSLYLSPHSLRCCPYSHDHVLRVAPVQPLYPGRRVQAARPAGRDRRPACTPCPRGAAPADVGELGRPQPSRRAQVVPRRRHQALEGRLQLVRRWARWKADPAGATSRHRSASSPVSTAR